MLPQQKAGQSGRQLPQADASGRSPHGKQEDRCARQHREGQVQQVSGPSGAVSEWAQQIVEQGESESQQQRLPE